MAEEDLDEVRYWITGEGCNVLDKIYKKRGYYTDFHSEYPTVMWRDETFKQDLD